MTRVAYGNIGAAIGSGLGQASALGVITVGSDCSIGREIRSANAAFGTSSIWEAIRLTKYIPFYIDTAQIAYKMGIDNFATVSGNFDLGILETDGTRLVRTGSTAHANANLKQRVDITDTPLVPGCYVAALTFDNITATINGATLSARMCRTIGMMEETPGTFGIPTTATFAAVTTSTFVPQIIIETRNVA